MPSLAKRSPRSGCPIATALETIGDRWTLVIARDMLVGKKRFVQFLDSPEHITTNVLTERLLFMEQSGLVEKSAYQQRPQRFEYTLTQKGRGLIPVLHEICRWANLHVPDTWTPPQSFMELKIGPPSE